MCDKEEELLITYSYKSSKLDTPRQNMSVLTL